MTHAPLHEFGWLSEDVLNERTSLPKTLMQVHMPAGKGDVTLINQNIRSAWALSLRPDNVGIPAYEDEQCAYNELLVIYAELSEKVRSPGISRLQEMLHRAIPYPLFLWLARGPDYFLSTVPLRHSRAEKGKEVWDGAITRAHCLDSIPDLQTILQPSFSHTVHLRDLYFRWGRSLYGHIIHSLPWKEVLGHTRPFSLPATLETGRQDWESLSALFAEWKSLDFQLNKERQPNHRVALGNRLFDVKEKLKKSFSFSNKEIE